MLEPATSLLKLGRNTFSLRPPANLGENSSQDCQSIQSSSTSMTSTDDVCEPRSKRRRVPSSAQAFTSTSENLQSTDIISKKYIGELVMKAVEVNVML